MVDDGRIREVESQLKALRADAEEAERCYDAADARVWSRGHTAGYWQQRMAELSSDICSLEKELKDLREAVPEGVPLQLSLW